MENIMEKEWIDMIQAFLRLQPQQRSAEAEKRLDEILKRMAEVNHITVGEAYAKLVENRNRMYR